MGLDRPLESLHRIARSTAAADVERTLLESVIRTEEVLDGPEFLRIELLQVLEPRRVDRRVEHGDETIVADDLAALVLFGVQNPDELYGDEAPRKGRRQMQDQHIERIAVLGARAGNRAEVIRKDRTLWKDTADAENVEVGVVFLLVAAACGSVDHHVHTSAVFLTRGNIRRHTHANTSMRQCEDQHRLAAVSGVARQ